MRSLVRKPWAIKAIEKISGQIYNLFCKFNRLLIILSTLMDYALCESWYSFAALTKPANNGWPSRGVEVNSGWN